MSKIDGPMCAITMRLRHSYGVASITLGPVITKNYGVVMRNYDRKIVALRSYGEKITATRYYVIVILYRSLLYARSYPLTL